MLIFKNIIDIQKLPYKIGDYIQHSSIPHVKGIIICYFFIDHYNNYYWGHYGYTIKLINSKVTGNAIGYNTYSFTGVKITSKDSTGYWWVLHDDAVLVRRSLLILLKL